MRTHRKVGKANAKKRRLIFVTSNQHKFGEVKSILAQYGVEAERKTFDFCEDDGTTIENEAINKAKQAYAKFRRPLIVEDTGFFFKAYKNFPGTQPKRMFELLGYDGFFRLLKGKNREAYAEVVICYITSKNNFHVFTGKLHGTITRNVYFPRKDVMPYEKVFRIKGDGRLLAEITREEKNKFSHRAKAAKKLGKYLVEQIK